MNVTRDVVIDLLPLYSSGEASADTRALVEDFLRSDPELAALARSASRGEAERLLKAPADAPPDGGERAALERSRRLLRRRGWTMGFGFFFTLLPFSFVYTDSVRFVMVRDEPLGAAMCLLAAACLWSYYVRLNRRLAGTGL